VPVGTLGVIGRHWFRDCRIRLYRDLWNARNCKSVERAR
jgi:hypothetical protein